jgi:hypothetical protein
MTPSATGPPQRTVAAARPEILAMSTARAENPRHLTIEQNVAVLEGTCVTERAKGQS